MYTEATVAIRLRLGFSPFDRRFVNRWFSASAAFRVSSRRYFLSIGTPLPSDVNTTNSLLFASSAADAAWRAS